MRTRAGTRGLRRLVATFATVAALGALLVAAPATPAVADGGHGDHDGHGPYAVGSRTFTFVDTSRPTPANGSFAGAPSRTLQTLVLYPAGGPPGGAVTPGAKPARTEHGFPLIVFSHGFGASGPMYAPLLQLFARAGYVVAAPTFPLSNFAAPGGPTITDYVHQPGDVSFVITSMLDVDRHDRGGLRHDIDEHHIGVAGHSLGAITTLLVATNTCCEDPRIDAAVSFSGLELGVPGGVFFGKPTPPLMVVHGTADGTVPYQGSVNVYAQSPAPKAFLTLIGAPHTPFSAPWIDPTVKAVVDFLDGFLGHDHEALEHLRSDGTVPGVSSVQADLGHHEHHEHDEAA
ncbi:MAG TPA: phospholipase [Acidimicrobiia bacterium]